MQRILASTLLGLCFGVLCAWAAFHMGLLSYTPANLAFVLLNRAVMGFAIGISGLRLRWAWNGIVVGLAVGSIFSFFLFLSTGQVALPLMNFCMNGVFGLLIEAGTTKLFRQPAKH
jgi:hypothetical protein